MDNLFKRSKAARDDLARIPLLVERYKQGILAAAFRGELIPFVCPLREIGELAERVTKGESPKWQGFSYVESGTLFIRSQNVGWGELLLEDRAYLSESFNEGREKSVLRENDVLLNIVGASIGRTAVASKAVVGSNCNQAVAIIRLGRDRDDAKFLSLWLRSPAAQRSITLGSVDVARANFSLGDVKNLQLPWPESRELRQNIVHFIERSFARIDEMASEAVRAYNLVDRLDQATLAKAFCGELVSSDEIRSTSLKDR